MITTAAAHDNTSCSSTLVTVAVTQISLNWLQNYFQSLTQLASMTVVVLWSGVSSTLHIPFLFVLYPNTRSLHVYPFSQTTCSHCFPTSSPPSLMFITILQSNSNIWVPRMPPHMTWTNGGSCNPSWSSIELLVSGLVWACCSSWGIQTLQRPLQFLADPYSQDILKTLYAPSSDALLIG